MAGLQQETLLPSRSRHLLALLNKQERSGPHPTRSSKTKRTEAADNCTDAVGKGQSLEHVSQWQHAVIGTLEQLIVAPMPLRKGRIPNMYLNGRILVREYQSG